MKPPHGRGKKRPPGVLIFGAVRRFPPSSKGGAAGEALRLGPLDNRHGRRLIHMKLGDPPNVVVIEHSGTPDKERLRKGLYADAPQRPRGESGRTGGRAPQGEGGGRSRIQGSARRTSFSTACSYVQWLSVDFSKRAVSTFRASPPALSQCSANAYDLLIADCVASTLRRADCPLVSSASPTTGGSRCTGSEARYVMRCRRR